MYRYSDYMLSHIIPSEVSLITLLPS